jgi:dihydroorotate dehydrogenase
MNLRPRKRLVAGARTPRVGDQTGVDLGVTVGSLSFPNPVMTASGTAGHGAELAPYAPLHELGAVVVKCTRRPPG